MKTEMTLNEAVNALADGHSNWYPSYAQRICFVVGVPFSETLAEKQFMEYPPHFKGLACSPEDDGQEAVYSLRLSGWVAKQLGVYDKVGVYGGRGFQAQAYSAEIRKKLEADGKNFETPVDVSQFVKSKTHYQPMIHLSKKIQKDWEIASGHKVLNGRYLRIEEFKLAVITGGYSLKRNGETYALKDEAELAQAYIDYRDDLKVKEGDNDGKD